jgi:ribosomal protein S18 acetylase RimI-like enzyme
MTNMRDPLEPVARAHAATVENLAAATTGRARRSPGGAVLAISGAPLASLNSIIDPGLQPSPHDIADLAASEREWDVPWSIHVRGEPDPQTVKVAAGYGLTQHTAQPLMIRRPDQGMPPGPKLGPLRVRAVAADELDVYARAVENGFEAPRGVLDVLENPAVPDVPGIVLYLADLDGVIVGTGMAAVSGDLLGVSNITTVPQYRRLGYGRAVTLEVIRRGFAAGATTAYLYASEMAVSVYESVGFRTEEYRTVITAP